MLPICRVCLEISNLLVKNNRGFLMRCQHIPGGMCPCFRDITRMHMTASILHCGLTCSCLCFFFLQRGRQERSQILDTVFAGKKSLSFLRAEEKSLQEPWKAWLQSAHNVHMSVHWVWGQWAWEYCHSAVLEAQLETGTGGEA